MKRLTLLLLPLLLCATAPLPAAVPLTDAPPIDANAILQELAALRQKVEQVARQSRETHLRSIQQAAGSESAAIEFYKNAIKALQFAGRQRGGADFTDWRSKGRTEDKLKSREFRAAVQCHLRFLAIALEHAQTPDNDPAKVNALMAYAAELQTRRDKEEIDTDDPMMNRPLNRSAFVEWLDLGSFLPTSESWKARPGQNARTGDLLPPGDTDAILEKGVLPALREAKSPLLLQYWDSRVAFEEKRLKDNNLAFAIDRFNRRTRPQYIWSRAEDKLLIGLRNSAIRDMFDVIRACIDHPNLVTWITRLETVLKGDTAPAQTTPAR